MAICANPHVVLTTGCNCWDEGVDVAVEGKAIQVTDEYVLRRVAGAFAGWGIPTADSLRGCRAEFPGRLVFASGGIRDGIEAAKAIALGADLVGLARPFLEAAARSEEAVLETARLVVDQLRVAMFCCGAANLAELRKVSIEHEHEHEHDQGGGA